MFEFDRVNKTGVSNVLIADYFYVYDTEDLFEWYPPLLYAFIEATKRNPDGTFKYHLCS